MRRQHRNRTTGGEMTRKVTTEAQLAEAIRNGGDYIEVEG
jgi:hypothetical protein